MKFASSLFLHMASIGLFIWMLQSAAQRSWQAVGGGRPVRFRHWGNGLYRVSGRTGPVQPFNEETVAEIVAYGLMGLGAVTLVLAPLLLIPLVRHQAQGWVGPNLRLGIVLGLSLSAGLTLLTAGYMSTGGPFCWRWQQGCRPAPWLGGQQRVRISASHISLPPIELQVLPLVGWLADRYGRRSWVWIAVVGGVGITLFTFIQALMGQPFIGVRQGLLLFKSGAQAGFVNRARILNKSHPFAIGADL